MAVEPDASRRIVAICGGVGGAKLALGLQHVLGERLTLVVNVGDDFDHLGLRICPDIDTVLYTLAGLSDESRGWGRAGETWNFMSALRQLGGEDWFSLGDQDLALHVERTRRLVAGESLTSVVDNIRRRLGIAAEIVPVTDDDLRTKVETDIGTLDFQRYFVEHHCQPRLRSISFQGVESARLNPLVEKALVSDDLAAIVICPSNPYLSIDPILAVPVMRAALRARKVPSVVVSPIVGGQAVKGPTVKIMSEMGLEVNSLTIATHYADIIDGLIIDHRDAEDASFLPLSFCVASTLMTDFRSRVELAQRTIDFAAKLRRG